MKELTDARWIKAKGALFLCLGLLAAGLLVSEHPSFRTVFLLGVAVWAFCRSYYFAFYVIEHYVDPGFRFRGLWAFVVYLLRADRGGRRRSNPSVTLPPRGSSDLTVVGNHDGKSII